MTPARAFRLLFILFLALHTWKIFRLLPVQRFADGQPMVEYHYSQIYADVVQDRAFRQVNGHSWGYDPYSCAGQISGAGLAPGSHAILLLDRFLRWFDRPDTTIKIFTAFSLLAGPLLLFASARMLRFPPKVALLAAALMSAGMISHDELSRQLVYRGHITFWLGCFVALVNVSSLQAWTLRPRRAFAVVFTLTWPLLLLLDPSMAIVQLIPTVGLAFLRRDQRIPAALWLGAGLALAVIVNAFWLVPYIKFHKSLLPLSEWPSGGFRGLAELFLPVKGDFVARMNAVIRGLLLVMAVAGAFEMRNDKRRLTTVFTLWTLVLMAIGIAGSAIPAFRAMEPGRLVFAATTILLLPAASFAASLLIVPGSRRILFGAWLLWLMMTWQLVHPYEGTPLRTELTPRERRLLADFRHLPPAGRILVQYNPLFTDGLRLAALQRVHTYAGFPGSWWKSRANSDGQFIYWAGKWYLFGRELSSCTTDTIDDILKTYNVAYVVTTAPKGEDVFSRLMGFTEVPSHGAGAYHIFRVPAELRGGYVLSGSGRLTFGYSSMHIRNAHSGVIVTSFRYADGFQTDPPLIVRPVRLSEDSPALLAFENKAGRSDIEVRYAGR